MHVEPGSQLKLGPLAELAHGSGVTDIVVTCDGNVWVDRGHGLEQARPAIPLEQPAVLRSYAVQLCAQLGCRLDDASPIADASASDGTRIHAVIAPIVPYGAAISIRLPDCDATDLRTLVSRGLCPQAWLPVLRGAVAQRASILIAGGTGSGKTTLLKALMMECAASERIITVEEVRELGSVQHANMVSLVARQPNVEGAGGVGLPQLVKATLRMRPDRIVVGECRGEEIADLLRALNSGHSGGMTTLHADGVERVPARLATLGLLAGLTPEALSTLVAGAFDLVCFMERSECSGRRERNECSESGEHGRSESGERSCSGERSRSGERSCGGERNECSARNWDGDRSRRSDCSSNRLGNRSSIRYIKELGVLELEHGHLVGRVVAQWDGSSEFLPSERWKTVRERWARADAEQANWTGAKAA